MPNPSSAARLFTGALCAAALLFSGCDSKPAPAPVSLAVSYIELKPEAVILTTELSGRASAYKVAEVRPQVTGIIQSRLFTEGSVVTEGQVLYQIDPSLYQAAYDSAKAGLMRAEANAKAAALLAQRYGAVVGARAVSRQEYDNAVASYGQAEAEVAAAKASLETARINLEYTKVTSPISGNVDRSNVTQGALATQNQQSPLTTVQQIDKMYVDVTQPSTDMLRLNRSLAQGRLTSGGETAMKARLILQDDSLYTARVPQKDADGKQVVGPDGKPVFVEEPIMGEVQLRDVTVDESTGSVTIRILFDNPDRVLKPGMYVRAVLVEGEAHDALLVPQRAVSRDNAGRPIARVLTKNTPPLKEDADAAAKDNHAKEVEALKQDGVYRVEARMLGLDRVINNEWLLLSGLKPGDLLLVDGLARPGQLVNGSPVEKKSLPKAEPQAERRSAAPKKGGEVIPETGK